jgi:hypothetical protein
MNGPAIAIALALLPGLLAAQEPPRMFPELGATPDLSPARFAAFAAFDSLLEATAPLTAEGQALLARYVDEIGEEWESPCDVVGMGCSWYCGGGPDTVLASSSLPPEGTRRYDAVQAHDLDHCTAWSEGAGGPGIGERLIYRFAPDSPRLHTVCVSNGLVRSPELWRAYNRVKRLRMEENGAAVAELELADTMDDQCFKLPRLFGRRTDGRPMELTFTILEVYAGERFDDTVITELWFDGIDVH